MCGSSKQSGAIKSTSRSGHSRSLREAALLEMRHRRPSISQPDRHKEDLVRLPVPKKSDSVKISLIALLEKIVFPCPR